MWGSKNEVVAPKCRFRTQFLNICSGKSHFGADFSTYMAFSQNTFAAPKFVLYLNSFLPEDTPFHAGEHLNDISAEQIPLCAKAKFWEKAILLLISTYREVIMYYFAS